MLPSKRLLREQLRKIITAKGEQGHDVSGLDREVDALPDSYDSFEAFALELAALPLRDDWPYVEPSELDGIKAECDPARPTDPLAEVDLEDAARRVRAAFLGSVCGCILGKPLEIMPTMHEIRAAAAACGDWPLDDYISEQLIEKLGRRHRSFRETVRERIRYVAPDDDLNYTIMGMLILEDHGAGFTKQNVKDKWLYNLPVLITFGPERSMLLKSGIDTLFRDEENDFERWVTVWNHMDEFCGALIRADAYGYACAGWPALAADLAWRDASWTHRRTGIYGTMFTAAAIATAQVTDNWSEVFETALQFVPRKSRFYEITADCLTEITAASDWIDGYERVHGKYECYGHCRIFQEVGTLINTLRFAESVGDGICKQVAQGNDTDSFGATAGSLLGAFFGPGHLEDRWLAPFNDEIRTGLARFHERSLSALADRMAALPGRVLNEVRPATPQPAAPQ